MKKIFKVKNNEDLYYPVYYKPKVLLESLNDMVNAINDIFKQYIQIIILKYLKFVYGVVVLLE